MIVPICSHYVKDLTVMRHAQTESSTGAGDEATAHTAAILQARKLPAASYRNSY
jgi:hypothetical protein